jgi:hypothetical protein
VKSRLPKQPRTALVEIEEEEEDEQQSSPIEKIGRMMMMEENSSIKSAVSSMVLGSSSVGGIAAGGESAAGSEIIPHHQQLQHDPAVNATTVSVRIYVPELNVQKVIHFHREELVWNVKQQCLASLPKVSAQPTLAITIN